VNLFGIFKVKSQQFPTVFKSTGKNQKKIKIKKIKNGNFYAKTIFDKIDFAFSGPLSPLN